MTFTVAFELMSTIKQEILDIDENNIILGFTASGNPFWVEDFAGMIEVTISTGETIFCADVDDAVAIAFDAYLNC